MSEKIYIITAGIYSDYHIIAATDDLEKAKAIQKKHSIIDEYCSEIPSIEVYANAKVYTRDIYKVDFKESGDIDLIYLLDSDYEYEELYSGDAIIGRPFVVQVDNMMRKCKLVRVYVEADDKASAIKIAAEKRAKYLAEQAGL